MKTRLYLSLTALALALLSVGNAFAQATASGTIQGTVIDQSQAVVPGAEVVITSKATGEKRTAATNGEGLGVACEAAGESDALETAVRLAGPGA